MRILTNLIRIMANSLAILCVTSALDTVTAYKAQDWLNKGPRPYDKGFHVFCNTPKKTNLVVTRSFSSISIDVKPLENPEVWPTFYHGKNESVVRDKQKNTGILPRFTLETVWPSLSTRLSALDESCLGVHSDNRFEFSGKYRVVDGLYLGMFMVGLFVFLSAPVFSRSVYFHYSSGVAIGILASLLVVVYILSRFIPKKVGAGAFLLGGWAIVLALVRQIVESFFYSEYRNYIAVYFIVAGGISFVVCYWYGPVQNERTMHILEGALYSIGSALMFFKIQHRSAALVFIVLISIYKCIETHVEYNKLEHASKVGAGAFLLGGWAIVLALVRQIVESFFYSEYRNCIAVYFLVAGVISFVVCYWYGPVQNERTMHILEGALYFIGGALMFFAIQHRPAALVFIVLISIYKYSERTGVFRSGCRIPWLPRSVFWRCRRPPKRRRLTMAEFDEEGVENTRLALEELREYCNSPQCKPWKMIAKMKTPDRFAKFVMGEDHVSEDELTLYESDMSLPPENSIINDSLLTSDDDSD